MEDFKSFSFNPSKHLKEEYVVLLDSFFLLFSFNFNKITYRFVSNLSGSSIIELISLILIVPVRISYSFFIIHSFLAIS